MFTARRKRYPMDIPFERTSFRKLATAAALLVCASFGVLRAEELRCERIMLSACQNLVYDMTIASAPEAALDYLAHSGPPPASAGNGGNGSASGIVRTWLDADRLITSLRPVIDSGCSKQALFLFCSSLFPLCSPTAPRPVQPCRSLCEQVRKDCFSEPPNSKLWPAYLDCRALPQPEKHELCMQVPSDATGSVEHYTPAAPVVGAGVSVGGGVIPPSVVQQVANTKDVVGKGWFISNLGQPTAAQGAGATSLSERISSLLLPEGGEGAFKVAVHGGTSNRSGVLGSGATTRTVTTAPQPCPVNYSLEYDRCVPRCGPTVDALYSQRQKELIESWTLVLSAVCFIFTFTSLVAFWTKTAKLEYPDRPILFMTLCYNLLGLCYLERTILHSPRRFEAPLDDGSAPSTRADCSITSQCLAYYILKHYLLLSASTWWLIYGLCWYLSTAKQWSCEALERKSGLFHVLAWVVPFAAPIGALLRGNIQRFELTGFCTARGFTELPTLLLLMVGAALVCLALAALARLRLCWNQRAPHLSRVFGRVLTFAVCYLLPALSATICMMLERVEHELEPCPLVATGGATGCSTQPQPHFTMLPTALRLALTLLGGGFVGVWLWSRQTTTDGAGKTLSGTPATAASSYYASRDLTLLTKGPKATPKSNATDGRSTATNSRRTGTPASLLAEGGPRAGLAFGPEVHGHQRKAVDSSGQARSERTRGTSIASPYRTASKTQKYCYVYRPCSRTLLPEDAGTDSVRSSSGRRSQCLDSGFSTAGATSGASGEGGGAYMPVRVYRSLRPVPVSMITRI
ncbi:frizzled-3 [Anopheles ziemanni]|uniref:frizzled-3 n=1 Tax=Anopheles coustani TaxID=139045 RepID=UPI00265936BA|nr:frizzled-3 [Anopheles coustani]XP_058175653.1 frizzled-3 [Anopheles ziemanni]